MGLVANLVEFPAVPKGSARFRLLVMADHTEVQIEEAVAILMKAYQAAQVELDEILTPDQRAVA